VLSTPAQGSTTAPDAAPAARPTPRSGTAAADVEQPQPPLPSVFHELRSRNLADLRQEFAWSLAASLMVAVTLFKSDAGYGAMPTAEFDGAPESVRHIYDPWED
jgi:hypothetical protein